MQSNKDQYQFKTIVLGRVPVWGRLQNTHEISQNRLEAQLKSTQIYL